ncbi:acetyl-CoA synthetase-like protein [Teratosphaeria nubilosa]|uniref:Acetyl-CoA synthetase-like protein n=1 Tax=Teratosphaeria nubilosa TaxID=161662 RepID=A0A6G1LE07_9PEZI|nr:acetyl-CoA synthetase-like protein [Teratosphaeria nubilosa]
MSARALASRRLLLSWRETWAAGPRSTSVATEPEKSGRRSLLTRAYDRGPSEPALLQDTIPEHFAGIVRQNGDRPAVISRHQQTTLMYDDLDRRSNSLARGLQTIGVRKGDRVAVSLGNNIEFAITTYALFKLGAILNPLNPSFNVQQVVSATKHLDASHLIIGAETNLPFKAPRSNVELLRHMAPGIGGRGGKVESDLVPSLSGIVLVDNSAGRANLDELRAATPFEDVLHGGSNQALPDQGLSKDDVVNIQFTSGTTSMPKAACLTHHSILNNGHQIGDRMLLTPHDVVCCPPPLFHCFGCILGYMATATHGSAILFPAEAFDPLATLKAVREYKATALYGVATMFLAELELLANGAVEHEGFEHLRTGIAAGSSVPAELMRKLHKVLNLTELTICYGMTETSPVSCMTRTDDPIEKRIDTVGRLLPHVEAKVVDIHDHSKILGIDERGELAVSGYLVMKEYWNDPSKTREAFLRDPSDPDKIWMLTGDEASMDAEGYVKITGRIKDLIIRGGENIHPLEVENCLLAHEAVREVSVVGLPDEKYGEVVAAFVVVQKGREMEVEDVRAWVRERLSGHLVPKFVFWVQEYPKTASGKIQKFRLREIGLQMVDEGRGLA